MDLCGLQKLTLLDFPEHLACTVFTGGCNMRCPFCHNAPLVLAPGREPKLPEEEFFSFLRKRRGVLDGVCITGGEPTLQPDLEDFVRRIRQEGFAVKLDTNGTVPDRLAGLLQNGLLDYVAMDIKSCPAKYAEAAGVPGFDLAAVQRSIDLLRASPVAYEFRTTVVSPLHTEEDLLAIGRWLQGAPRYFLQNFVASDNLIGDGMQPWPPAALQAVREKLIPYFGTVGLRGI